MDNANEKALQDKPPDQTKEKVSGRITPLDTVELNRIRAAIVAGRAGKITVEQN